MLNRINIERKTQASFLGDEIQIKLSSVNENVSTTVFVYKINQYLICFDIPRIRNRKIIVEFTEIVSDWDEYTIIVKTQSIKHSELRKHIDCLRSISHFYSTNYT